MARTKQQKKPAKAKKQILPGWVAVGSVNKKNLTNKRRTKAAVPSPSTDVLRAKLKLKPLLTRAGTQDAALGLSGSTSLAPEATELLRIRSIKPGNLKTKVAVVRGGKVVGIQG